MKNRLSLEGKGADVSAAGEAWIARASDERLQSRRSLCRGGSFCTSLQETQGYQAGNLNILLKCPN